MGKLSDSLLNRIAQAPKIEVATPISDFMGGVRKYQDIRNADQSYENAKTRNKLNEAYVTAAQQNMKINDRKIADDEADRAFSQKFMQEFAQSGISPDDPNLLEKSQKFYVQMAMESGNYKVLNKALPMIEQINANKTARKKAEIEMKNLLIQKTTEETKLTTAQESLVKERNKPYGGEEKTGEYWLPGGTGRRKESDLRREYDLELKKVTGFDEAQLDEMQVNDSERYQKVISKMDDFPSFGEWLLATYNIDIKNPRLHAPKRPGAAPAPGQSQLPQLKSIDEVKNLKKGQPFLDPNGVVRIAP